MNKFPRIDWRFTWIGLAVITFIIRYVLSLNPTFTEIVYTRGVYTAFRYLYDYTLGFLPVPMLYIAVALLLGLGIYKWRTRPQRERPWPNRIASFMLSTLAIVSIVLVFFFLLWGFNYYRVPVERQMELLPGNLSPALIQAEAQLVTREVIEARTLIPHSTDEALDETYVPEDLESTLRRHLVSVLRAVGYHTPGRVRTRRVFPKGWMMRLGATGIYIPFVLEGHIDGGLHPISRPYTMAHELSHGYGFGDEGTANFWAYLTTQSSDDPFIRYSGSLYYWLYIAGQLRAINRPAYEELRGQLPDPVLNDIKAIRENNAQYPEFFPILFEKIYDNYLKSQGVEEGVLSYSRVVELVIAWRKKREE